MSLSPDWTSLQFGASSCRNGKAITAHVQAHLVQLPEETAPPAPVNMGTVDIPPGPGGGASLNIPWSSFSRWVDRFTAEGTDSAGAHYSATLPLTPIDLAIDANRDGTIAQGEHASQEKPFRFWINNDSDKRETEKEEEGSAPDYQSGVINNTRDLEDFNLLQLSIPAAIWNMYLHGNASIGLKWKDVSGACPGVKVFRVADAIHESKDYLWNLSKAETELQEQEVFSLGGGCMATVDWTSTTWLSHAVLTHSTSDAQSDEHPRLLFEGSVKGKGQLCLVIKINGVEMDGPGVWLKLMDVEEMFASVQGTPGMPYPNPPDHIADEPQRPATWYQNIYWPSRGQYQKDPDETDEAIVMVHGWNMTDPDRRTFSESFFKRLWWKGYKGLFCTFAWPTYNSDNDMLGFIPDHYNKSEYVAWKYGPALKAYVDSIYKSSKSVAAHSMGNVVMASALKSGLTVNSYVAMEAALPSGCYDASVGANSYGDFLDAEQVRVTPDLANPALGYRGLMTGISGNFFNFHSGNDYALATGTKFGLNVSWEGNQIGYKPNYQLHYQHNPGAAGAAKNRIEDSVTLEGNTTYFGRDITDHHEVMSFIARPRSKALGTQDTAGFTNFNLKTMTRYPFGTDRTEHSGQYQRPIQKTHMFFNTLLQRMNVGFNDLDDSTL